MKLSIIIPHYKETEDIINSNLSVLNAQIGVDFKDFEVILISDGGAVPLSREFLSTFNNLQLTHVYLEKNVFCGMARQAGIDIAKGEYIGFVDADDSYYSCDVLQKIWTNFDGQKKFIVSDCIEEKWDSTLNKMILSPLIACPTILHGTFVLRQHLIDHNIKFRHDITFYEDLYFTTLCNFYADRIDRISNPVVIWRASPTSMTRKLWDAEKYDLWKKHNLDHYFSVLDKILERFGSFTGANKLRAKTMLLTGLSWVTSLGEKYLGFVMEFIQKYKQIFTFSMYEFGYLYYATCVDSKNPAEAELFFKRIGNKINFDMNDNKFIFLK